MLKHKKHKTPQSNSVAPKGRFLSFFTAFIDFKIGLAGGLVMGVIVFYINYYESHELAGATIAALKQGAYTFLFGGTIMKICEHLAVRIHLRKIAILAAIVLPSTLSIGLTLGVHSLRGTPKPLASTIPTAIFVIPSTAVWGIRKRREND
jgi:hypothetical protein